MIFLQKYIRYLIVTSAIILSIIVYVYNAHGNQLETIQKTKLEEIYAFLSLFYLYIALLYSPLYTLFPFLPFQKLYLLARRAIGVSSFFFALLHTIFSFNLLGGFFGLSFLNNSYLSAIIFGFIALFILLLMTLTSFDYMVVMLGKKWKKLHRFVYIAGLFIVIHTVMLGSHFSNLFGTTSQIFIIALIFLLLLETVRFDIYIAKKISNLPRYSIAFVIIIAALSCTLFYIYSPTSSGLSQQLNVHSAHQFLAKQALEQSGVFLPNNIPGLNGDRTKRYTVSFAAPDIVQPGQDTTIRFRVYDASSGNPVSIFRILYAKTVHMIVVNSSLSYFEHIHPTQDGYNFVITTQFPQADVYHIYLEFQPYGGIEQQIGFTLPVGVTQLQNTDTVQIVDKNLTKIFGDYQVSLNTSGDLSARNMTLGERKISFTIKDVKTRKPITNLKPYLASFGHLTMINEDSYDFLHVHPYSVFIPSPDANGGPTIDFLPIGIYGPFRPGVYKMFAEFNPGNHLFVADFTVRINP